MAASRNRWIFLRPEWADRSRKRACDSPRRADVTVGGLPKSPLLGPLQFYPPTPAKGKPKTNCFTQSWPRSSGDRWSCAIVTACSSPVTGRIVPIESACHLAWVPRGWIIVESIRHSCLFRNAITDAPGADVINFRPVNSPGSGISRDMGEIKPDRLICGQFGRRRLELVRSRRVSVASCM